MSRPPVKKLSREQFEVLQNALEAEGFSFEERPHQVFLARRTGVVVSLYNSGKIVLGGSDTAGIEEVIEILDSLGAEEVKKKEKELPPLDITGTRIGTDEVGKGDYFGPLVVAGVLVTEETEKQLKALGVRDSKTMSDTTVTNMAIRIRQIVGRRNVEEIAIGPLKYNLLQQKLRNVNRILGWAHARAIENILSNGEECKQAVADQFGDQRYIDGALMRKGQRIRLIQVPKAERDVAVAAASVLARDVFLRKFDDMRESYLLDFPKGATHVVDFGKDLVETHGIGVLQNVAKLHFSTTKQITGGVTPVVSEDVGSKADLETVPREPSERELKEASLEIFNLIDNFEREFRKFLKDKLSQHYGKDWWERGIDKNIRKKCEHRQRDEKKKGRKVTLLDCLEFPHYPLILTSRENWEQVFLKVFKVKDKMLARLTVLKDWRDPVYHARGTVGAQEKAEVVSAINQLRRMMRLQKGLDEFA
jgi:ribonuclease HIII